MACGNTTFECDIQAHAVVRGGPDQLLAWRRDPGMTVSASALRNVDDQSVAGFVAVVAALRQANLTLAQCTGWGIVAAPRFLGRTALIVALRRFAKEGAWGVSPHVVPQQSQHAVAGVVSTLLGIQGPSLGAGGGPGAGIEAAQVAATMLQGDPVPGVWLVITGWDPEPVLDEQNRMPADARCHALALGLTAAQSAGRAPRLCVCPDMATERATDLAADQRWFSIVEQLDDVLPSASWSATDAGAATAPSVKWPLSGGIWIAPPWGEAVRRRCA